MEELLARYKIRNSASIGLIAIALLVSSCNWRFGRPDEDSPDPEPEQPTGTLPVTVTLGATGHTWTPKLGGCTWMPTINLLNVAASVLPDYPRPVLVDIKAPCTGFGYRFDLDEWDQREGSYTWYTWIGGDRGARAEDILQICEASGNAEFIFHVPLPRYLVEDPWENNSHDEGEGYLWQTPAYYAAMVQYLFGLAGAPADYESLPASMDFFDASVPAAFNWANLRARRGRVEPYPITAVIIGQEPYNIGGWASDGTAWGAVVEETRAAIRARGLTMPLGLHVKDSGPPSDSDRTWFRPMMQAINWSDFEYIDLHHYYLFNSEPEDYKRVFPVAVAPNGFQNNWPSAPPPDQWHADYTRFLWLIEDTRYAIDAFDYDSVDWKLGFGEHGLATTSSFAYNDMGAGLNWAAWLAEGMRQNTDWDSNWVLFEQGSSHAQIQIRSHITKTPGYYVYEMAMGFHGLVYRELEYEEEMGTVLTAGGGTLQYPYLVLRGFQEPSGDRLHLFAVNLSESRSYELQGFEGRTVSSWKRLSAPSYDSMNYFLDENWAPPTVYTEDAECPATGEPIIVPPISVNHIVLE